MGAPEPRCAPLASSVHFPCLVVPVVVRVRDAAKEALDAVFSENAAQGSGPQQR